MKNAKAWNSKIKTPKVIDRKSKKKTQRRLRGEGEERTAASLFFTSLHSPSSPSFGAMPSEESKPVKKEVEDDDDYLVVAKKVAKVKKEGVVAVKKEAKVKNEDNDDLLPLAKRTSNSKEVKKKKVKEEEKKKKTKEEEKKKREKKVYDLPGQKRDPPEEKDPLRIFYETLYKQVPYSEMSQIWLMESGLLPKDVAMKVFEKKQKRGGQQRITSPIKAVAAVKSSTKSVTVKKKSPASLPSVKKKTANSTSKQSKKRKSKDQSSEDECDSESDDEVIISARKRRKLA